MTSAEQATTSGMTSAEQATTTSSAAGATSGQAGATSGAAKGASSAAATTTTSAVGAATTTSAAGAATTTSAAGAATTDLDAWRRRRKTTRKMTKPNTSVEAMRKKGTSRDCWTLCRSSSMVGSAALSLATTASSTVDGSAVYKWWTRSSTASAASLA